jgi:hypothetical protein
MTKADNLVCTRCRCVNCERQPTGCAVLVVVALFLYVLMSLLGVIL